MNFAEWKVATVGIDYHVEFDHHYYSVPYRFARQKVDVRATQTTVELFHRGVASPAMFAAPFVAGIQRWMPHDPGPSCSGAGVPRLMEAGRIGPHANAVIEHVPSTPPSIAGIPQLPGHSAFIEDLQLGPPGAACERAIDINALSFGSLKSILKHGSDNKHLTGAGTDLSSLEHANVRGPHYYHLSAIRSMYASKTIIARAVMLPSIPKELIDQMVSGLMDAGRSMRPRWRSRRR
ncbi:MAG: transposase [Betaproteobacteria bacterium]|nr:transposase [Betaproteobacteria bacterium]